MNDLGGGDQGDGDCGDPSASTPSPQKIDFEGYLGRPDSWAKVVQDDPKWVKLA